MSFTLVKPGFNVHRPHPADIILSDLYPTPKINTKAKIPHAGVIFLNWASGAGRLGSPTPYIFDSFEHGFDYIPTVFATYKYNDATRIVEGTLPFQFGALGLFAMSADKTNINLEYYSYDVMDPATAIDPFTLQIRYYVMVEHG